MNTKAVPQQFKRFLPQWTFLIHANFLCFFICALRFSLPLTDFFLFRCWRERSEGLDNGNWKCSWFFLCQGCMLVFLGGRPCFRLASTIWPRSLGCRSGLCSLEKGLRVLSLLGTKHWNLIGITLIGLMMKPSTYGRISACTRKNHLSGTVFGGGAFVLLFLFETPSSNGEQSAQTPLIWKPPPLMCSLPRLPNRSGSRRGRCLRCAWP